MVAYQLAFVRPGICPRRARFRRQSRHMRKRRKNARGRPHSGQRLYARTLNFGGRDAFTINDVFAIALRSRQARNGMPSARSNIFASASVRAVVQMTTVRPLILSTLSKLISGKITCSRSPSE